MQFPTQTSHWGAQGKKHPRYHHGSNLGANYTKLCTFRQSRATCEGGNNLVIITNSRKDLLPKDLSSPASHMAKTCLTPTCRVLCRTPHRRVNVSHHLSWRRLRPSSRARKMIESFFLLPFYFQETYKGQQKGQTKALLFILKVCSGRGILKLEKGSSRQGSTLWLSNIWHVPFYYFKE